MNLKIKRKLIILQIINALLLMKVHNSIDTTFGISHYLPVVRQSLLRTDRKLSLWKEAHTNKATSNTHKRCVGGGGRGRTNVFLMIMT
jgi:hypothetical protein